MNEGSLLAKTRELLRERPRNCTYLSICLDTGISIKTLQRISLGTHTNVCVNTIQSLYEFLSGRKLDV